MVTSPARLRGARGRVDAFDFVSTCPLNLRGCCFCSFSKLGLRMIVGRRQRWRYGKRVQIPRCRATVSEDNAIGHWDI